MNKVKCLICNEIFSSEIEICPVCGVGKESFVAVEIDDISQSDNDINIIIIGNGMASIAAAEAIRSRNNTCSIEIISEESISAYQRPMLTKKLLDDLSPETIEIKKASWYKENNVKETLNIKVDKIDSSEQKIFLDNGEIRSYDKLIIATGATSFVPPIPGANLSNVVTIRNYEDVKKIQGLSNNINQVTIIGGGVLGLEAAWEFAKVGKKVTILEMADKIMPRQLDEQTSDKLKEVIESKNIIIKTGVQIANIVGDQKVTGVKLATDEIILADLVVLSTGIRANTVIAQDAGITINRAIVVDEYMQTNVNNIYACGDCAEYQGINFGIAIQALEMGKVAGANVVGDKLKYQTVDAALSFTGMDISLYAIGDVGKNPEKKYEVIEKNNQDNSYEKYYFIDNQLVGAILFNNMSNLIKLLDAYRENAGKEKFQ